MDPQSYKAQEEASRMTGGFIPHPMVQPLEGGPFQTPMQVAISGRTPKPASYGGGASSGASSGGGLGGLVVIGLLVAGWLAFSGHHGATGSATQSAAASSQTAPLSAAPDQTLSTDAAAPAPAPDAQLSAADPAANTAPPAGSDGSDAAPADALGLTVNGAPVPELASAAHQALDSGQAVSWTSPSLQLSGYVSVSTEQAYGDRVCRNYLYTTNKDANESGGGQGMACKGADGIWRPGVPPN